MHCRLCIELVNGWYKTLNVNKRGCWEWRSSRRGCKWRVGLGSQPLLSLHLSSLCASLMELAYPSWRERVRRIQVRRQQRAVEPHPAYSFYGAQVRLKPNSWTYNFVEVSGHNFESSQTWGFPIQCLHYKPVSNQFCSREGRSKKPRWLWIARKKTIKTFVPITSKNSASDQKLCGWALSLSRLRW